MLYRVTKVCSYPEGCRCRENNGDIYKGPDLQEANEVLVNAKLNTRYSYRFYELLLVFSDDDGGSWHKMPSESSENPCEGPEDQAEMEARIRSCRQKRPTIS